MINIPGLPEGVQCVRIGKAEPGDYEIITLNKKAYIVEPFREDSVSQIIVIPAPGYRFIKQVDIQNFQPHFVAVKDLPSEEQKTVRVLVTFTNTLERDKFAAAVDAFKQVYPGEVTVQEEGKA